MFLRQCGYTMMRCGGGGGAGGPSLRRTGGRIMRSFMDSRNRGDAGIRETALLGSRRGIGSSSRSSFSFPKASGEAEREVRSSSLYKPEVSDVVSGIDVRKIKALRRHRDGSRFSQSLREDQSMIPGILYGKNKRGKEKRMLISIQTNQIQSEVAKYGRSVNHTVYDLELDGNVQRVLLRDLQLHPVTDEPVSVNFLRYHSEKKVKVWIPIEFYNEEKSIGLKRGGQMRITMRDVELRTVPPAAAPVIPSKVRLNLDGTQLGQKVRAKEIPLPEGLEVIRPNEVALTIVAKKQRGLPTAVEGSA